MVMIDPAGRLVLTETEIAVSALPEGIMDYVTKNLNGKKIKNSLINFSLSIIIFFQSWYVPVY